MDGMFVSVVCIPVLILATVSAFKVGVDLEKKAGASILAPTLTPKYLGISTLRYIKRTIHHLTDFLYTTNCLSLITHYGFPYTFPSPPARLHPASSFNC